MTFSVVIPARYASTRLPAKPLLDIAGKPMIQHVWERALHSDARQVIVATDDQRIAEVATAFGAEVAITREDHPSGTDRLQEVAQQQAWTDEHIVVNVQGDEPLIPPSVINQVAANLQGQTQAQIATLCEPINSVEELRNPNMVKVVTDANSLALYFSRAPIPWPRELFAAEADAIPAGPWRRHIGLYAYRTTFLHQYVNWLPSAVEQLEQLEQLRALHNGAKIHVAEVVEAVPAGVDTRDDLEQVRAILAGSD